ncbi:MAG: hypothetical protein ABFC96_09065 [Thermoguttaceae bacterium]
MHRLLAVAVVALLGVTIWMLAADGRRHWKEYQQAYRSLRHLPDKTPAIDQICLPGLTLPEQVRGVRRRDRCTTCHQGIDQREAARLPQPHAAHPRLDLFVAAESPHPTAEFGCTVCHEGQGSATDFRWASHLPDGAEQTERWRTELVWSPNPDWDQPMLPRRFSESRCLGCHEEVVDLEPSRRRADPPAADLVAGYHLVRQYGCFGCHEIPTFAKNARKVGPSLRNIAGKFGRDYVLGRLRDPATFRPTSRMPRLFGLDEHLSARRQAETRQAEEAEIQAVADYLLARAEHVDAAAVSATPSADRGKRLLGRSGCVACHRHPDFPGGTASQGPELSNIGEKYLPGGGRAWLVAWLRNPAQCSPQTLMPKLLDGADAADVAEYLLAAPRVTSEPRLDLVINATAITDLARRTMARRGCSGCHDIPGLEDAQPIGPSLAGWGRKATGLLAFERVGESAKKENGRERTDPHAARDRFFLDALLGHRREGFLWRKLLAPRSFDHGVAENKPVEQQLRMGRFQLDDAQRQTIITFILAQTADSFAARYSGPPDRRGRAILDGRKALDKYGCVGCHTLEFERWTISGPSITAARGLDAQPNGIDLFGMPRLDASGRMQQDEDDDGNPLYFFTLWEPATIGGRRCCVGGPDVIVPAAKRLLVRPPRGGDAARLMYSTVLADAHRSGASSGEVEAWGWLPPPLVGEGEKAQPEWLFRFLRQPDAIRPAAALRMPRFNLSNEEARQLADYFAATANAEYPYLPSPAGAAASGNRARLDAAMRFISDRNAFCGRCHSIGDRLPPGRNPLLHAPALDQVARRLRPEYLRRWLADPKAVLPYTTMPTLFPATGEPLGQDLLPGSSREQLDAVVALLLQFDQDVRRQTPTPAPRRIAE